MVCFLFDMLELIQLTFCRCRQRAERVRGADPGCPQEALAECSEFAFEYELD